MFASHPEVVVKLVLIISTSVVARLRDLTDKLQRYVLMANAISAEFMSASLPKPIWPNRTFRSSPAPKKEHLGDAAFS